MVAAGHHDPPPDAVPGCQRRAGVLGRLDPVGVGPRPGRTTATAPPPTCACSRRTVNLLADMEAQPGTLMTGLVAATASHGHHRPGRHHHLARVRRGDRQRHDGHGHRHRDRRRRARRRRRGVHRRRCDLAPGDGHDRVELHLRAARARVDAGARSVRSTTAPTSARSPPGRSPWRARARSSGRRSRRSPPRATPARSSWACGSPPTSDGFVTGRAVLQGRGEHRHARRFAVERHRRAAGDGDVPERDGDRLADRDVRRRRSQVTAGTTYVVSYTAPAGQLRRCRTTRSGTRAFRAAAAGRRRLRRLRGGRLRRTRHVPVGELPLEQVLRRRRLLDLGHHTADHRRRSRRSAGSTSVPSVAGQRGAVQGGHRRLGRDDAHDAGRARGRRRRPATTPPAGGRRSRRRPRSPRRPTYTASVERVGQRGRHRRARRRGRSPRPRPRRCRAAARSASTTTPPSPASCRTPDTHAGDARDAVRQHASTAPSRGSASTRGPTTPAPTWGSCGRSAAPSRSRRRRSATRALRLADRDVRDAGADLQGHRVRRRLPRTAGRYSSTAGAFSGRGSSVPRCVPRR